MFGLTSVILCMCYYHSKIFYAMTSTVAVPGNIKEFVIFVVLLFHLPHFISFFYRSCLSMELKHLFSFSGKIIYRNLLYAHIGNCSCCWMVVLHGNVHIFRSNFPRNVPYSFKSEVYVKLSKSPFHC